MEVFESIIDWWTKDTLVSMSLRAAFDQTLTSVKLQETSPDAAFELVDVLLSTAQNATHMLCESITSRISSSSNRRPPANISL